MQFDVAPARRGLEGEREFSLDVVRLLPNIILENGLGNCESIHVVRVCGILGVVLEKQIAQMLAIMPSLQLHVAVAMGPFLMLCHHFWILLPNHVHLLGRIRVNDRPGRNGGLLVNPLGRIDAVLETLDYPGERHVHDHRPTRSGSHDGAHFPDGRARNRWQREGVPVPGVVGACGVRHCDRGDRRVILSAKRDPRRRDGASCCRVGSRSPVSPSSRKDEVAAGEHASGPCPLYCKCVRTVPSGEPI
mmetsp:Transcript_14837/g.29772  ORF Transcript_14837/g.29772 Transcript_14837/m.29772 type:complete len:247 (+) Transcript_14837:676-1416(+)